MKGFSLVLIVLVSALISTAQNEKIINKTIYKDKLRGFWLGQCIANWTGIQTEGAKRTKPYFTDDDWSKYGFILNHNPWVSDDDTDIEYIFQHAMETYKTSKLTGEQIRDQWLEHISPYEENYLWVSNESAFRLMRNKGLIPPATGEPANNPNWEMIDAQLTTEIFGFFAPANPAVAKSISLLPISTTAYSHSMYAAQFYVYMYSLASSVDTTLSYKDQLIWMADSARELIPDTSYISKMYDWVKSEYLNTADKNDWEKVRDAFHDRYRATSTDGYKYKQFYDSGINFGFSIISLLFGEGDYKKTIQIGTLSGMDSDNPTATWGALLGFMYGHTKLKKYFDDYDFSDRYDIAHTRIGFGGMEQYDTYDGGIGVNEEYIGYTYDSTHTFSKVIFTEGKHFGDGGWFANGNIYIQVRQNGIWDTVPVSVSPLYPIGNSQATFGDPFETYTFSLNDIQGDGIRLFGNSGGGASFISIVELEVMEDTLNIASKGTIIATVTKPTGGGSRKISCIRDGVKSMESDGIDNFTSLAERGLGIIDLVVTEQMYGSIVGDNWVIPIKTAGISELQENENLNIYPNPTSDVVNLSQTKQWMLYSIVGELLQSGESNFIDLSTLSSGVYVLSVEGTIHKIIKK